MHEFTIAKTILKGVLKKASKHNTKKVSRVGLRVGLLKMVTPISLQNARLVMIGDNLSQNSSVWNVLKKEQMS